ncbi:MAG: hypothetical protein QXO17_05355 [Nitrososphaerota archaeon]|nr:hypothetical protein [Candidatus Calditenuis fumarioli]
MRTFAVSVRRGELEVRVEGGSAEEVISALPELRRILEAATAELRPQPSPGAPTVPSKRRGKSEAVLALEIIETQLIPSGFFSSPRSTKEVREEIQRLSGLKLQSRKVSQALGVLYEKGVLRRTGPRGDYRYFSV